MRTLRAYDWKHFSEKPPEWWNPPEPGPFERHQLELVNALVEREVPTRLLEIGIGRGRATPWIQGSWQYVGVDVNLQLLSEACRTTNLPVVLASGTHLPFRDRSFDAVVSIDVFMHVWQRQDFLQECRRVLSPKGLLILNFLRRFSRGWKSYWLAMVRHPKMMSQASDRRFDVPQSVERLLVGGGFSAKILMAETSVPIVCAKRI